MIEALVLLLVGMVIIGLIIVWNGFHVAQEFSYMSVDRNELRVAADDGDVRAGRALDITRKTSFMLSGAQLGITVTGLLVATSPNRWWDRRWAPSSGSSACPPRSASAWAPSWP